MKVIGLGVFLGLWIALSLSVVADGMYKCLGNNGEVSYQAVPCKNTEKEAGLNIQSNKLSKFSQCNSMCRGNETICIAELENGSWSTDGGLDLCKEERKVCELACVDPKQAERLKSRIGQKRSSYESQVRSREGVKLREKNKKTKLRRQCAEARMAHKRAVEKWDDFGNQQKLRMSKSERNHYLDKIDDSSRKIRSSCLE